MGAAGTILPIVLVVRVEADEGIGALIVAHVLHRLDATEFAEESLHVFLSKVVGEVLGVDVVVDLPEVTLVAWLVADDLDVVSITLSFEGCGGSSGILEADEAIPTGLMVRVEGDLEGLNLTIAREVLLKGLRRDLLRDLAHEDVVIDDLLRVGAEKIVVEGKSAGGLAIGELEVSHLLAGEGKLVLLGDRHDGRVEGTVQVTTDLRHALKHNTGLRLKDGCEPSAGGF